MSLTILHQYCPVKLYFSISEIKDNNDSPPPKGTISYYWTKAKQKLQNTTYKLSPSSFIFNNQKEAL